MDVDYLVDEVFKKQEPLDIQKVKTSSIQWHIPLADYDRGKTFYASVRDNLDPFEILRAAKAIPFLFGKRIPLAHHRYIDGEAGAILQDHLSHALSLGARNIVILNHTSNWTSLNSIPARIYGRLIAHGMHDAILRDIANDVTAWHATNARVILLSPTNLACGTATIEQSCIKATFDRGVQDARALKDHLRMLSE